MGERMWWWQGGEGGRRQLPFSSCLSLCFWRVRSQSEYLFLPDSRKKNENTDDRGERNVDDRGQGNVISILYQLKLIKAQSDVTRIWYSGAESRGLSREKTSSFHAAKSLGKDSNRYGLWDTHGMSYSRNEFLNAFVAISLWSAFSA